MPLNACEHRETCEACCKFFDRAHDSGNCAGATWAIDAVLEVIAKRIGNLYIWGCEEDCNALKALYKDVEFLKKNEACVEKP